jgi:predicted transcriptional regulator
MGKIIIGVKNNTDFFSELHALALRVEAGEQLSEDSAHLDFSSVEQLFAELSPTRQALLRLLQRQGPLSIYELAKRLGRHYSSVHRDIGRLVEYGLIAKNESGQVFTPWSELEIRVSIGAPVQANEAA